MNSIITPDSGFIELLKGQASRYLGVAKEQLFVEFESRKTEDESEIDLSGNGKSVCFLLSCSNVVNRSDSSVPCNYSDVRFKGGDFGENFHAVQFAYYNPSIHFFFSAVSIQTQHSVGRPTMNFIITYIKFSRF